MEDIQTLRGYTYRLLRWSERYAKTDMVYLMKGGFWLLAGQAIAVVFSLVLAVAFGHFTSQDTYGNYKYALSLAGLLSVLSLSGMTTAITQSVSKGYEGVLGQGFRLNLKWSALVPIASACVALYYLLWQHNPFVAFSLCIVGVSTPLLNSFSLYDSYLVGKKEFKRDTIYGMCETIFSTLCIIGALLFTTRAIMFVIVYFVANLTSTAFFYFQTMRLARNRETDPGLLRYSTHLSIMNVIATIADKIDSIAIFTFLGPASLAAYTYAIAIPEQLKVLIKMVVPLSMPKFAERPFAEIRRSIWGRVGYLALATALFIVVYVICAPLLFRILFPIYIDSIPYSQWYSVSLIFTVVVAPLLSAFQAHKKTRAIYITNNVGSIVLIISLPLLTYHFGIAGAIASQFTYRAINSGAAVWQLFASAE